MDDDSPELAVGFTIDTGGAFAEILRFSQMFDERTADIVRQIASVEKATGGMVKLSAATAEVTAFANAATRAEQDIRREKAQTEQAIDRTIKQIERETIAVGKTRDEVRMARIDELALAAARQGNTDAADRLLATVRQLRFVNEAAAQDKFAADTLAAADAARVQERAEAAVIAQLRERSNLEAALARTNGTDRPTAVQGGATFSALAERERALELAERETTEFRRQNGILAERANLQAAIERNTDVGRVSAIDAGATFSALAARAAEEEARAHDLNAAAVKRSAEEHARLVAIVRGSQAAQQADAAAAERLRMATDPLYTATKRLNDEIAESTRLYISGATAAPEYARQQQVLADRLREVERAHDAAADATGKAGKAGRLATHDLLNLGYQINDIIVSLIGGQKPLTVFAQQGAQIGQIAATSGVGIRGMAASVVALAVPFLPLIAVMGVAAGGVGLFVRAVNDVDTKAMIDTLGLTRAEVKRLENTSVTTGDVVKATFQVMAERAGIDLSRFKGFFGDAMDFMTTVGRNALAGLYAGFVGTFNSIAIVVEGVREGKDISDMLTAAGGAYEKAFDKANGAMKRFGADVEKQIASNKLKDLQKQANEIKLDRPDKVDKHAEQLAREAQAMEAQIRNLYRLVDAYGVSGAAALIAEARVKAESAAIKKRGDIEEFVARQVRLAVAERVADAAKSTAAMRDQAAMQRMVNGEVAAGNVPAERAAELLRDRLADLPLLAAIEAARTVKDAAGAKAATDALEAQRAARVSLTDAERAAALQKAMAQGADQLEVLREELRLVGATEEARARSLAILRATQYAASQNWTGVEAAKYITQQGEIAAQTVRNTQAQDAYNDSLTFTADKWDIIAGKVQSAASGMAEAFGSAGRAIGDIASIYAGFNASRERAQAEHDAAIKRAGKNEAQIARENARFALRSSGAQIEAYGDMVSAAKGFFKEGSGGYKALAAAEKAYRVVQFAMSVQAMIQNAAETLGVVTGAAAKATAEGAVGVAKQSQLPFPANIAAMAATGAALLAAGIAVIGGGGGGGSTLPKGNDGTGTVLGDATAKSESINRALDQLRQIDTLMLANSRQMLTSLRSIDQQIGGLASVLVRSGNINADDQVATGFKTDAIGSVLSKIPLIGGFLGSLFGTKTSVLASGIYGSGQSIGDILGGGFDAKTYSDVEKKKKFLGITTSTKYSTQYGGAVDSQVSDQFALILRSFNDAIVAAAGPLGQSTADIAGRVSSFVFDLGKIDLKGLTGTEIQEKLTAVFGAAADSMASAGFPGIERLQKVGEGAFETLVRVASTVETVSAALDQLGAATAGLGIDAKVGLADQFDTLSDLTSAVGDYFDRFYTPAEQNAARLAQLSKVFVSMNLALPDTLAGFRALVDAQDLNTEAGRAAYATLLQLAPAFGDLKASMEGAKSAADILGEQQDLQRKLLELNGDTAAIRALDLAKLDASNRALQMQVWAVQDAQEAAKAAQTLADAWISVGTSIGDEIKRIRGLSDTSDNSFAALQGQFNAATTAARGGDMDAAKLLPALSQSLLKAAGDAATSRQELARVQAMTAASLEVTNAGIATTNAVRMATVAPTAASAVNGTRLTSSALLAAASNTKAASTPVVANDDTAKAMRDLRLEVAKLRAENNAGHAATAGNTGRMDRRLESVTAASGGEAISVAGAA